MPSVAKALEEFLPGGSGGTSSKERADAGSIGSKERADAGSIEVLPGAS
jgi:hypothetical protein